LKNLIFIIFLSLFCLGCISSDSDIDTSVPSIDISPIIDTNIYTIDLSFNDSSKIVTASVYKNGIRQNSAIVTWSVIGNATYSVISLNQIKLNFKGTGIVYVIARYNSVSKTLQIMVN